MWFALEAAPLSFTESSRHRIENSLPIEAPAARVFEILVTGERQAEWFEDFVAIRWTTPEPHGVGSEREVELEILTVKERFLAWEPGRRVAFHVYAITLPLAKVMLEDMRLEPTGERSCRFSWTVHYEPSLVMRLIHPIGRLLFGKMFRASAEGLARYARAHPG